MVPAVTSEFDEALLEAARKGDLAKVEALLAQGADVKAVDASMFGGGYTLLHHAAEKGHTAMVDTLLAHGAGEGGGQEHGMTAAALGGNERPQRDRRHAAKRGRRRTAKDVNGKSPADVAKDNKHPIIVASATPRSPRRRARS